ncbi:hypothetical protein E2562_008078 [Oryza meyeriana var. granulata]|uniref:Uncharacterized protein n=1 Tax=Oryza meyeriana var. granulata TaxID=110450 RepID=A0A6G1CE93_9ORYZ|nr:hypothetical protein E2562_008078 [Oryza meyeriana var. granulata]
MDAGDEVSSPPSSGTSRSSAPPSDASSSGSIPATGDARSITDVRPDAEPVAWFLFADTIQAHLPGLLAVATDIVLNDSHLDGFVLAGPVGDAFAVRRDSVLGLSRSNSAGETSGISWRAVVCTTSHAQDAGARVEPFPAGWPYVVVRGSWGSILCSLDNDGVHEPVDRIMTCCRAVLCRGCAEVNPCGCPQWQNRRGFPVPILTEYHIDEDCMVEGAVMLRRPTWQQFYARRTGESVSYGFYNVEDAHHRRERGVRYQIHTGVKSILVINPY